MRDFIKELKEARDNLKKPATKVIVSHRLLDDMDDHPAYDQYVRNMLGDLDILGWDGRRPLSYYTQPRKLGKLRSK